MKTGFKTMRLVLSGALLGVAAANAFLAVDLSGEIVAGVVGAGGALALLKATAVA
ncbi:hypothetical protein [uncultured Pseudomonas sp.]|uniref:hypothetical protein n=1 Tax=uncultured Pseudomonas sp. TaxID=114707 RepID=UPI0025F65120|nr:hypothetical protein [uncultured Pseudomonas sp.]